MNIPTAHQIREASARITNNFRATEKVRIEAWLKDCFREVLENPTEITEVKVGIPSKMQSVSLAVLDELLEGKGFTWKVNPNNVVIITW